MTEAQAKYLRMIFCAECRHAIAAKVVATVGAILVSFPAMAQISCGELPKDLPVAVREQLKGDVEGKAQLLTKMLGDAQLKGKVETSRTELHQEHSNLDQ